MRIIEKMQIKNTKIQIFVVLLFLSLNSLAQNEIKFEYISLAEGLSQSSVTDIHRDKDGYMWFATFDGLNKFDGYKIEIFRTNPRDSTTISDNSITCIFESKQNEIWLGHKKGGISVYNKFAKKFYHYKHNPNDKNSLVDNDIRTIKADINGDIWVGTSNGLSKISRKKTENGKQITNFTNLNFSVLNPYSINSNEINKIICGKKSILWLATSAGICELDIKTLKAKNLNLGKTSEGKLFYNVLDILLQKDSVLWIATDNGLGKFLLKEKQFTTYFNDENNENSLSNNEVNSLALDNDGSLWVATKNGLNHYNSTKDNFRVLKSSVFNLNGLNSSEILSLFIDKESILWVGTSLGGVNKWNRPAKQFQVIKNIPFDKTSLSSNKIRSFFQDNNNNIWVGTVDAGLNFWDKKNNTFTNFKPSASPKSISDVHIRTAAQDQEGRIWFGTNDKGIDLYNSNKQTFTNFSTENTNLTNDIIWSIIVDTKNRLWVGTLGGGLCVSDLNKFDGKNLEFQNYLPSSEDENTISDIKISCVIEDRDSNIWIGTRYGGLNRLDKDLKKFTNYKFIGEDNKTQTVDRIYSILEDSEGIIWVGTRGSLNKYNKKTDKFKKYDYLEYKFPNPIMMGIVEDDKQNIWVSTNRGLACFNKDTEKTRNYDVTDGLQSNEFMMGAYIKTNDHQILFGGQTGFNAFYPNEIKDNPHKPEVLLTNFLLFNKIVKSDTCVSEREQINLIHSENTFTFEFVGIDYVNSAQNKYAYKLEGFDKDWQYVETRKFASYTNIAAGNYVFRVKAANNDGIWNEKGTSIRVNIKPPFWETTWFAILSFLSILLIGYSSIRFRDVYRDKSELELKVVTRTKEVVRQSEAIQEKNEELKQQQEEILAQRDELEEQRDISEERRIAIMDSISYAERIQRAILPPSDIIEKITPEHFILFKPRDIVSGDYYWMSNKNNKLIITAADCTGHGVPGAFLSMLGVSFLNEIVGKQDIMVASDILGYLREKLIESLHQTGKMNESKDGMDLALCVIDPVKMQLQFSGAYNPLFLFRLNEEMENGRELIEIKGDRMPVGISEKGEQKFINHVVRLKKGDAVYLFSDGYPDQFGGPDNKKFKIKTFRALLLKIFDKPMIEQQEILNKTLNDWQLDYEQIDDILVMGIRI